MKNAKPAVHITLNLAPSLKMVFGICCETSFVFHCVLLEALADRWGYPGWFADECYQTFGCVLDCWQDLNAGRAVTDQSYRLTLQAKIRIPRCAVDERALIFLDARDWGISPGVQNTARVDQDMCGVGMALACLRVEDLYFPFCACGIPDGVVDFMAKPDVFMEIIFRSKVGEILVDFFRRCVCR